MTPLAGLFLATGFAVGCFFLAVGLECAAEKLANAIKNKNKN